MPACFPLFTGTFSEGFGEVFRKDFGNDFGEILAEIFGTILNDHPELHHHLEQLLLVAVLQHVGVLEEAAHEAEAVADRADVAAAAEEGRGLVVEEGHDDLGEGDGRVGRTRCDQ